MASNNPPDDNHFTQNMADEMWPETGRDVQAKLYLNNGEKIEAIRREHKNNSKMPQEIIGSHSVHCDQNLFVMHLNKNKIFKWNFTIKSKKNMRIGIVRMFLLDSHMPEFFLENVKIGYCSHKMQENSQFWECSDRTSNIESLQFTVSFTSPSHGNFQQQLIVEFQNGDKVLRHIGVQVLPEFQLMETLKFKPVKTVESELAWVEKCKIIPYDGEPEISFQSLKYPLPPNIEDLVLYGAFDNLEKKLTNKNYRERLHLLLHIEENKRRQELQELSFEVEDIIDFVSEPVLGLHKNRILKIPSDDYYTEQACRLIGKSGKALIKIYSPFDSTFQVYEVRLEQILCNEFIFEMSSQLDLLLHNIQVKQRAIVCFRFVDVFQYMHNAIDKVNIEDVFPSHCSKQSQAWNACRFEGLTKEQSVALSKMIDCSDGPPVILLGPFGSGKTRTMAHAVIELYEGMKNAKTFDKRILICTHSNSAADHYIEDFIDPYLNEEKTDCPVLIRVNWELRYTASVSATVLKYCKVINGKFAPPAKEDIEKHIIVISTLVTADLLHQIGVDKNFFTHIFIDEAAQAMEVEAIIPFMLKGRKTKVILAGDHLQLGFPLVSKTAKDLGLGISLLERLFQDYPSDSQYKLKLLENHRSFPEIVEISSSLFYEGALISNKQRPQDMIYPVRFYGIHGKEEISQYHPSVYNLMEAHEVLHRIQDLIKNWPRRLSDLIHSKICVLSCYPAQIQEIRLLLRRNGLSSVRVENVNNVQGLEFDVIIISAVRCYDELSKRREEHTELGFLGSPKLFNTAITRAKFNCIIIGEPVALCSFGACKALWKTVLAVCHHQGEFHYRLTFEEVMEISEKLRETLKEDHTVAKQYMQQVHEMENNLYKRPQRQCLHSKTKETNLNAEAVQISTNALTDGEYSNMSSFQSQPLQVELPDAAEDLNGGFENAVSVSPTPTEMSYFSDISNVDDNHSSVHSVASNNVSKVNEKPETTFHPRNSTAKLDFEKATQDNRPISIDNIANQPASFTQIQYANQSLSHPPYLSNAPGSQSFRSTSMPSQPYPVNITNLPNFSSSTPSSVNLDDLKKIFAEVHLSDIFVSRVIYYGAYIAPQIESSASSFIRGKNDVMFEIQQLRENMWNYPADYIMEKCRNACLFFSSFMYQIDKILLQALPNFPENVFHADRARIMVLKRSLVDLKLNVESLLHKIRPFASSEDEISMKYWQTSASAMELKDRILFAIRQLDTWIQPILNQGFHTRLSSLMNFKLNFMADFTNALNANTKLLARSVFDTDSLRAGPQSYNDHNKDFGRDFYAEKPENTEVRQPPLDGEENAINEATDGKLLRNEIDANLINDSCSRKSNLKDHVNGDEDDDDKDERLVSELLQLTTEDPCQDVDGADDVASLIRKLRHFDNDIDEWFVNRETDPFVIEYIESFERYRAILQSSDNQTFLCSASANQANGDSNAISNQTARDLNKFDGIKRFNMKPPYQPYYQSKTGCFEGKISFEKSALFDNPVGIVLLGRRRICFPGLKALNRSMDGDHVLFVVVGKYGRYEKGQVTKVIERQVKSLLCKVSLNDRFLALPVDERGPPIITLNASETASSDNRYIVGSGIKTYLIKVIGWPINTRFPLGLIQREAQEHEEL